MKKLGKIKPKSKK